MNQNLKIWKIHPYCKKWESVSRKNIKCVAGQSFAIKRLWVWLMEPIIHISKNSASLNWTEQRQDKEKEGFQPSEILQDGPIKLFSCEHALCFMRRETNEAKAVQGFQSCHYELRGHRPGCWGHLLLGSIGQSSCPGPLGWSCCLGPQGHGCLPGWPWEQSNKPKSISLEP